MTLTKAADKLRNKYLGQVKRALRRRERGEAESLLAGVREHLDEALAQLGLVTIDESTLQSVLGTLATPASYAGDEPSTPKAERSKRWAVVSMACLGGALAVPLLVAVVGNLTGGEAVMRVLSAITLLCPLSAVAALVFGAMGFAHPLGKTSVIAVVVLTVAAVTLLVPVRTVVTTTETLEPAVDPWGMGVAPLP